MTTRCETRRKRIRKTNQAEMSALKFPENATANQPEQTLSSAQLRTISERELQADDEGQERAGGARERVGAQAFDVRAAA